MALQFDGSNDKVDHGVVFNGPTRLTVMFWVNPISITLNDRWMGKLGTGTATGIAWNSRVSTSQMTVDFGSSRAGTTPVSTLTTDTWKHFAWVYDGSQGVANDRLKCWVNGSAVALTYQGTLPTTVPLGDGSGNDNFIVGDYDTTGTAPCNAKLAFVRVWEAALSEAEIQAERVAYSAVRTSNLLLDCPYDDGTTAADFSGNGHNGTVSGAIQANGPLTVPFGASSGSYALTGTAAAVKAGRKISITAGVYEVTGDSVSLRTGGLLTPHMHVLNISPAYDIRLEVSPL